MTVTLPKDFIVTPPPTDNWKTSAKSLAATALLVAIGLYLAVRLIESVATVLIVLAAGAAVSYIVVLIVRYRRSRW